MACRPWLRAWILGLGVQAAASSSCTPKSCSGAQLDSEGATLLQVQQQRVRVTQHDPAAAALLGDGRHGGQRNISHADEVHCVFTVDCRPFNLWQGELLFFSAMRVGQSGPITQIVSGCSEDKEKEVMQRHLSQKWPSEFKIHFVPSFNDKKSHWLSKPYGVKSWYRNVGPERDVMAVLDPDFIFLRPLTAELDGGQTALAWQGEVPKRVQKGVVVAQRYSLSYPDDAQKGLWQLPIQAEGMDNAALLTYVCSGSTTGTSGCTNLTNHEMGFYQSTGVPYIAHRDDWDWLVDDWSDITVRLHEHSREGFYVDMWSWILSNVHRGQRQLVLHNYMLTAVNLPQARYEGWAAVDHSDIDACDRPLEEVMNEQTVAGLPHFIHYCVPQDTFNKYWFDWGADSGPHALERCDDGESSEGLRNIMLKEPVKTQEEISMDKKSRFSTLEEQHRSRFMGCTMRSLFKGALRRSCEGRPSAAFVSQ